MKQDTYNVALECQNCGKRFIAEVPKGQKASEVLCPECGLADCRRLNRV